MEDLRDFDITVYREPTPIHDELWRDTYAPEPEPDLATVIWYCLLLFAVVGLCAGLIVLAMP